MPLAYSYINPTVMKQPLLIMLLLLLTVLTQAKIITLSESLTNTTIGSVATYTCLFYRDINPLDESQHAVTAVSQNSLITLTFP